MFSLNLPAPGVLPAACNADNCLRLRAGALRSGRVIQWCARVMVVPNTQEQVVHSEEDPASEKCPSVKSRISRVTTLQRASETKVTLTVAFTRSDPSGINGDTTSSSRLHHLVVCSSATASPMFVSINESSDAGSIDESSGLPSADHRHPSPPCIQLSPTA